MSDTYVYSDKDRDEDFPPATRLEARSAELTVEEALREGLDGSVAWGARVAPDAGRRIRETLEEHGYCIVQEGHIPDTKDPEGGGVA